MRKSYAISIFRKPDCELYFLDETGFNLHNGPQFGYAPRGQTPHTTQPGNRGQNMSVLVCIGIQGVIHWECIDDSYNSDRFVAFLDNLCPLIESEPTDGLQNKILIMDYAVIHKTNAVNVVTYRTTAVQCISSRHCTFGFNVTDDHFRVCIHLHVNVLSCYPTCNSNYVSSV